MLSTVILNVLIKSKLLLIKIKLTLKKKDCRSYKYYSYIEVNLFLPVLYNYFKLFLYLSFKDKLKTNIISELVFL